jgi:lactoylglutathione lyase
MGADSANGGIDMRLAHTMIRVKDLDATLEFYRDFVGLKELQRKPIGDEATLIFLTDDDEGYVIELTVNHGTSDYELGNQFGHLAFFTDDLSRVIDEVKRRDWWFRESRPDLSSKYIFLKDPNGYDIEILER